MDAQRNRQALDRWFRAFNAKQFDKLAALLADIANDDVIQEWPQSGERIRGKDNIEHRPRAVCGKTARTVR